MWSLIKKNSHMTLSYWLARVGRTTLVVLPKKPIISPQSGLPLPSNYEKRNIGTKEKYIIILF